MYKPPKNREKEKMRGAVSDWWVLQFSWYKIKSLQSSASHSCVSALASMKRFVQWHYHYRSHSHTHTQRAHRSWVSLHRAKSTQPATSGKHFDQISGTNSIYRSQKLSRPLSEPFVQRGVRREGGRKSTNGCKEVPWLLTNITRGGVCFMYTRTTNIKTIDSQWTPDSLCNL